MSLLDYSAAGVHRPPLETALKRPERARKVSVREASKDVLELARVYTLELGRVDVPAWLDKLVHLRTLIWAAPVKTLPAALAKLPHLRFLHLEDSQLESLDGLEKLPALETITVGRTPVQGKAGALADAARRVKGKAEGWSIDITRKRGKPMVKNLAKALLADDIADESDLRGVDLARKTFEDLLVTHDLRKAKLAGTTWRRCDFTYAQLAGADLTGATFDDCYFESIYTDERMFGKAKLAGATFVRCGGSLDLPGADLTNAKLVDLESDMHLALDGAKAKGLALHATFASEKQHHVSAKGADLRGATVSFDITPGRRKELEKKPTGKLAWATNHLAGAKTDATTTVTYAPLPGGKVVTGGIDEKGPAAKALGEVHAPNAALWLLAIDGQDAAAWRGSVNEKDPKDDFQRALAVSDGKIKVGAGTGMLVRINDEGWSHVWQVDGGVALVEGKVALSKPQERDRQMALRVAQWAPKKVKKLGSIKIHSGVLALLLPFRSGTFTSAELKKAKAGKAVGDRELERVLIPLPNGSYDIVFHDFGPAPRYEDAIGTYYTVTRIVQS